MLRVGERIEEDDDGGARGTVRYVGPVATSKDPAALYYGIEWDAWGRGRNDGSVVLPSGERVAHFAGPAGRAGAFKCSFVKASKLRVKRPRDLVQQLQERYGGAGDASAPLSLPPAALDVVTAGEVGTTLGSHKPIELVGVEKLRSRQTLASVEKIALARCQLAALGAGELRLRASLLSELDLSFNLFASWTTIFRVARELPALETLVLTGNRMQFESAADAADDSAAFVFPRVTTLVLNQTLVTGATVRRLLDRHFPQVAELHLAENELVDADLDALAQHEPRPWMAALEVLDVSQNRLRSWRQLLDTVGARLPNLQQLVANANEIATLVTTPPALPPVLQQLRALSVSDNAIASWTSIDALNRFPRLDTLRFTRNPLVAQMGAGEVRMLLVARTEFVAAINGSAVRAKERQDAEQMYLKRILHELAAVGDAAEDDRARVLASHPRFARLRELYPDIHIGFDGSAGLSAGPATLAASLVRVKIVPMSMQATSFEPLEKRIPERMKVAQLKVLVEKKFGVEAPSQVLSFRPDARSLPCPLDDDSSEIGYYGLQDGAEILVNDV